MEKFRKNRKVIAAFLAPMAIIYIVFAVIPIVQSVYFAFFSWKGIQGAPLDFVGARNFLHLFRMPDIYRALGNVAVFTILNLILQIPLGYFLAYLLSSFCKGYRFFKTIFFSAVILPMTATSLLWRFIFGPNESGILNSLLLALGITNGQTGWLIQPSTALLCIIIANAWCGFGYHMTIGFAAMTGIPGEIMEAAEIDGATGARRFLHIMLPIIWEPMKTSIVLIVTGSIKIFDIVFIMTEGGPNGLTHVLSTLLYNEAFKYSNYGIGSAISVLIFVLSLLMALLSLRLMRREQIEY